ncbi:hypothetical protein BH11PSE12_BH11PSE12_33630 [soil metagenome]
MTVVWLALLSICLWVGFEFMGLARAKHSAQAASAFCARVKVGMPAADAQTLAHDNLAKKKFDLSDNDLRVDFGNGCLCNIAVAEDKVAAKALRCKR